MEKGQVGDDMLKSVVFCLEWSTGKANSKKAVDEFHSSMVVLQIFTVNKNYVCEIMKESELLFC